MGILDSALKLAVRATEAGAEKAVAKKAVKKAATFAVEKRAPLLAEAVVKPRAPVKVAVRSARPVEGLVGASSPHMISTRRPTAPNFAVHGDPDKTLLVQNGEALRADPKAFAKNMSMLAEEPFMHGVDASDPEAVYRTATRRGADNLKFIADELVDPSVADAAQEWYPVAHKIANRAADRNGLPREAGYGIAAVTSPQTPWDINVARLDRLMDMHGNGFAVHPDRAAAYVRNRLERKSPGAIAAMGEDYARRMAETPMQDLTDPFDRYSRVVLADAAQNDPAVRRVLLSGDYGDPFTDITWGNGDIVNKALNIADNPHMDNISAQMLGGGKVPSFYDNIAAPFDTNDVSTIDTHSAGAASLYPGGGNDSIVYRAMGLGGPGKGAPPGAADVARTGSKGLYGPLSDMHTLAGREMGVLPRGVQSITWEGVRGLWGQEGKTPALKRAVEDIWRSSSSPDEARFRVADLLGRPVRRTYAVKP